MAGYSAIQKRLEWMQSEDRFGVFVVLLAITAFIGGYEAWQAFNGAPFDSHLWAVPVICGNFVLMGMLAAKDE